MTLARRPRTQTGRDSDAKHARELGIDLGLIDGNLPLTPLERMRQHYACVRQILALRERLGTSPAAFSKRKEFPMKTLPLTKAKDDLSAVIRDAETEEILITRHGRPAAIIIGFADDDDWLEYRLLHDEGFLSTVAKARENIRSGTFTRLEDVPE